MAILHWYLNTLSLTMRHEVLNSFLVCKIRYFKLFFLNVDKSSSWATITKAFNSFNGYLLYGCPWPCHLSWRKGSETCCTSQALLSKCWHVSTLWAQETTIKQICMHSHTDLHLVNSLSQGPIFLLVECALFLYSRVMCFHPNPHCLFKKWGNTCNLDLILLTKAHNNFKGHFSD